MPRIEILAGELGPAVAAEAPEGGSLLDLCDEAHAPIPFSCRSATCGTCRVVVMQGAQLLEPARADERDVLAIFDAPPSHRLACQARLARGPGLVVLRGVADDE